MRGSHVASEHEMGTMGAMMESPHPSVDMLDMTAFTEQGAPVSVPLAAAPQPGRDGQNIMTWLGGI